MDETNNVPFTRHSIVRIGHPDHTYTAVEMIVEQTIAGNLNITRVPNTERKLPLTKDEAETWVYGLPGEIPEKAKNTMIDMLCCADCTHTP